MTEEATTNVNANGLSEHEGIFYWAEVSFDCKLTVDDTSAVRTLGDLQAFLVSKIDAPRRGNCLKHATFNRIRRGLIDTLGIQRHQVKPDTQLDSLFPHNIRRNLWCSFLHKMKLDSTLYYLHYPHWVSGLGGPLAVLSFLLALVSVPAVLATGLKMLPVLIGSVALCGLATYILSMERESSFATEIPKFVDTPRKLTNQIVSWNYRRLAEQSGCWNEDEIFSVMLAIVGEMYVDEQEKLSPSTEISSLELAYD